MAVTTKKQFAATTNATTTVFSPVSIQLNNQDDLDVYVTLSGGTRVLQLRQSTGSTAQSSHPQVNNTDGLYFPAVSAGTTLYNYQLSTDNNTITFNSALPQGAVVFCERRTRDADGSYTSFASGSTIRATDLNNSSTESNFTGQDARNKVLEIEGAIFNGDVISPTYITSENIVDGTIQTADIGADQITNALIADNQIDSEHYVDGSIDLAHMSANSVDSDQYVDGSIDLIHMSANSVDSDQYVNGSIDLIHMSNNSVDSDQYVDGSIDRVHLEADIIDSTKLADNAVDSEHYVDGSIDLVHMSANSVDSAQYVDGSIDGVHIADDAIITSKINNLAVTHDKLAEPCVQAENIGNGTITTVKLADSQITTAKIADDAVTAAKIADEVIVTNSEQASATANDTSFFTTSASDGRYFRQDSTETITSGATWSSSDSFVATTGAINARIIDLIDEVGGFTAIDSEQHFPNSNPQGATGQAAILSIQAASAQLPHPSDSNISSLSGTTLTIKNANVANNADITITGVTATIPSGFGFLVESTSTLHTYTFHRLVPKATEVTTVANNITNIVNPGANVVDINNFADLYQISNSAPTARADTSSLQEGDLWFDSSNDNMQVYDGSSFAAVTPTQQVLADIAIVSGAITYSEDLGLITNAVTTGSSNGSLDIVADVLEDEITFTVTAATGKFIIDGVDKPALTLYKGWTYTFDVSDASNASHPLRFSSGGSAYSTNVTVTGTQGQAGAKVSIKIPESQPTSFIYYCTNHSGMGNSITVKDDPIKTVSDDITKIQTVADNINNLNTVQGISANVTTVAGIASNVTTVANNNSNVTTVAGKATEIGRLGTADAVADMNTLGTTAIVSDLDTLADISSNITTVAGVSSNVTTVAGISSNVTAVAGNASNINAVAGNATNINAVAADATDIGAVAGKATEIGRLGTADAVADMNTLGTTAIVSDMDTLADISSNITTVAGVASNVTTVAGIQANVTTVANNNSNVTAVANNSSNINSAVSNASNINAAVSNASNINSVVSNATNINTVATNVTDVNTFANRYRIGSSNPSTSLDVGDLFFNTSANELRVYNGTQWQGGVTATGNLSQVSGSVFTGDNRYNDNVKAKFGSDSDLQIFHNTTDSIINASGTGNIKLQDQGNTKLEITSSGVSATGNIVVSGTVDGRDVATDGTKLDGIEALATADQTASEIVSLISGQTIAPNVITTTNLTLDFGSIA